MAGGRGTVRHDRSVFGYGINTNSRDAANLDVFVPLKFPNCALIKFKLPVRSCIDLQYLIANK